MSAILDLPRAIDKIPYHPSLIFSWVKIQKQPSKPERGFILYRQTIYVSTLANKKTSINHVHLSCGALQVHAGPP